MPRTERVTGSSLAAVIVFLCCGCAKPAPQPLTVVGLHHVNLSIPKGWEHLDHGRQHMIRLGEDEISLTDGGPATREAMMGDIRAALALWRAGHGGDAFDRIRQLRCPALTLAAPAKAHAFWAPWFALHDDADSLQVATAMLGLIATVDSLPEVSAAQKLGYVLSEFSTMRDAEVQSNTLRTLHGAEWNDVVLWSRLTHTSRTRVAFTVSGGRLLVLATGLGVYERQAPAFESVLTSLEIREPAAAR
jgi:hypothetical protein